MEIGELTSEEVKEAIEFLRYSNKCAYAKWKEKLIEFLEEVLEEI